MSEDKSFFDTLVGNCSPYWGMSTFLSWRNGLKSRRDRENEALSEKEFQEWVTAQKYAHEDAKEILEHEFKWRMRELQRENSLVQKELELDFDSQKDQLRMFVKGWPLKLSLQATQQLRESMTKIPEYLYVVIATHTGRRGKEEDMLTRLYDGNGRIVDHVSSSLTELGIPLTNILRFIKNDRPGGGAALANIFSMMRQIPTLVILPKLDSLNKKLRISIGYWSPSAKIPSQRVAFHMDYDELRMQNDANYKNAKQEEIETAYISLGGVMNDVYRMSVFGFKPLFIQYAKSCQIMGRYPKMADFIHREYHSLIDPHQYEISIDGEKISSVRFLTDEQRDIIASELDF